MARRKKKKDAHEHICPICGKEFITMSPSDYVYKRYDNKRRELIYFCGWNCMRKFDADKKHKKKG